MKRSGEKHSWEEKQPVQKALRQKGVQNIWGTAGQPVSLSFVSKGERGGGEEGRLARRQCHPRHGFGGLGRTLDFILFEEDWEALEGCNWGSDVT